MKTLSLLICLLLFASVDANASCIGFIQAVIYRKDGTQVVCEAKYPATVYAKQITYKTGNNAAQKMNSDEIKSVRYTISKDKVVEKAYLPYFNAYDLSKGKNVRSAPEWMDVLVDGPMMLSMKEVIIYRSKGRGYVHRHYFCKRKNEEVATEITNTETELSFYRDAPAYFADRKDISDKIAGKEKGYSANDIKAIVTEYNGGF